MSIGEFSFLFFRGPFVSVLGGLFISALLQSTICSFVVTATLDVRLWIQSRAHGHSSGLLRPVFWVACGVYTSLAVRVFFQVWATVLSYDSSRYMRTCWRHGVQHNGSFCSRPMRRHIRSTLCFSVVNWCRYTIGHIQGGPKSKPVYRCNIFVYCQLTFIIFGSYTYSTLYEICNYRIYSSSANTVCVTAQPCKILITTLPMFAHVHCR